MPRLVNHLNQQVSIRQGLWHRIFWLFDTFCIFLTIRRMAENTRQCWRLSSVPGRPILYDIRTWMFLHALGCSVYNVAVRATWGFVTWLMILVEVTGLKYVDMYIYFMLLYRKRQHTIRLYIDPTYSIHIRTYICIYIYIYAQACAFHFTDVHIALTQCSQIQSSYFSRELSGRVEKGLSTSNSRW